MQKATQHSGIKCHFDKLYRANNLYLIIEGFTCDFLERFKQIEPGKQYNEHQIQEQNQ